MGLILTLLLIWLLLTILGFAVKGLFGLLVMIVILLLITGGLGLRR